MRNTFIRALVEQARVNDKIILMVGDLGYSAIEPFRDEFPDRFINAGVAEQNMTAMAAGMASEGFQVFTYSIANFPTFRPAEQIRNDIDYHNLSVTVVSVGGGLAYGNLGYSHHAVQDFSLMRAMPNVLIAAPCDPMQTQNCVEYIVKNPRPYYLRLNKAGEPNLTSKTDPTLPGVPYLRNADKTNSNLILSTGAVFDILFNIWEKNEEFKSNWSIGNLPIWGESTRADTRSYLEGFDKVVSVEEHLLAGGFGSWLLETGINCIPCHLDIKSVGKVGSQMYLRKDLEEKLLNIINDCRL